MRAVFSVLVVGLVTAFLIPGLGTAKSGYKLNVVVAGNGSVSTSDQRIVDCRDQCTAEYANRETVELTARPGSTADTFHGWGEDCQGTTKCTVTMTGDRKVSASFSGTSPEPSSTATASPTATASAAPSATATATASPQPSPTATPAPSQSPAGVAAHLIRRVGPVEKVGRRFSVRASKRFTCRRECLVAAVVRSRSAGRPTLARGSARVRSGRTPGVVVRLTTLGRRRLADGGERARLRITVQQDGRFARRARTLTLRLKD